MDEPKVASRALGSRRQLALVALVFAMSLIPRLWSPSPFITWDEPTWTYRSMMFLDALASGDLANTHQSNHPGVPTMWAGAAGMAVRELVTPTHGRTRLPGDIELVSVVDAFDEDDTRVLSVLAAWWPWARAGIAFLTAALVALTFFLLMRLLDQRTALVAATMLSFGPYFLAHSRILQLDAVLAAAMSASAVSLVVAMLEPARRRSAGYVALAGALAGLAALEKSPALFLVPFTGLVVAGFWLRAWRDATPRAATHAAFVALAVWLSAAAVTYVVLWPALWADPARVAGEMWSYAAASAGGAREAVFFWGAVQPDPGVLFYIVALPFRLTPLAIIGLLGAFITFRAASLEERALVITLFALAVLFTLFMGQSAKKFERYILPVLPALSIVAAVGLVRLADVASRRLQMLAVRRGRTISRPALEGLANVVLVLALALQYGTVLRHRPYYLAWYNPVLGGGEAAAARLPVGWGEGMDQVAAYLTDEWCLDRPRESACRHLHGGLLGHRDGRSAWRMHNVATPSVTLLAPFGPFETLRARDWEDADYVVLYIDDVQIGEPDLVTRFHGRVKPRHIVTINGIDYAWIYRVEDLPRR